MVAVWVAKINAIGSTIKSSWVNCNQNEDLQFNYIKSPLMYSFLISNKGDDMSLLKLWGNHSSSISFISISQSFRIHLWVPLNNSGIMQSILHKWKKISEYIYTKETLSNISSLIDRMIVFNLKSQTLICFQIHFFEFNGRNRDYLIY